MDWNSFVGSPRILSLIDIARRCGQRPSSIAGVDDDYTAFCFDEACTYILSRIEQGEEPEFDLNEPPVERHFSSYSEMLKFYEISN